MTTARATRTLMGASLPFPPATTGAPWEGRGEWPARWIHLPGDPQPPWVAGFICIAEVPESGWSGQLHVSADERFELYLNGQRILSGPERGGPVFTAFETFDIELPPGRHVLAAKVWALGKLAPWAQISVKPGLIVAASDAVGQSLFATGFATWSAGVLAGYSFRSGQDMLGQHFGVGPSFDLDARAYPWEWPTTPPDFAPATPGEHGTSGHVIYSRWKQHLLRPAKLPTPAPSTQSASLVRHVAAADTGTLIDSANNTPKIRAEFIGLTRGREVKIPPGEYRRVLIDLDDYVCGYPELSVSGGRDATIEIAWAESLTSSPNGRDKGNRDDIEGKHFAGFSDRYTLDGADRTLRPLWWRCGRYIELRIRAVAEPLRLTGFRIVRTGYDPEVTGVATCDDPRLTAILPTCLTGWRACLHDTYMDCPFYEQMMYVGDTRIQALLTYVLSPDARPAAKALADFDSTRANPTLLVTSNNGPSGQMIPPFALWWVCMIADYARWRGDRDFIATLLPGARSVIDSFLLHLEPLGADATDTHAPRLVRSLPGWNYVDAGFPGGVPPGGNPGEISAAINLQLVIALDDLAKLETFAGDEELAARHTRHASRLFSAILQTFDTGTAIADNPEKTLFSEQTLALAILTGRLPDREKSLAQQLAASPAHWTKSQLYFSHYLFSAAARANVPELLFDRLPNWYTLQGQGFRAFPETLGETRSDCHAWSSHPRYHLTASIIGLQPQCLGGHHFTIRPMLGPLTSASTSVPLSSGTIHVDVSRQPDGSLRVAADLPPGTTATVVSDAESHLIGSGPSVVHLH